MQVSQKNMNHTFKKEKQYMCTVASSVITKLFSCMNSDSKYNKKLPLLDRPISASVKV